VCPSAKMPVRPLKRNEMKSSYLTFQMHFFFNRFRSGHFLTLRGPMSVQILHSMRKKG
jgi:hypothetical protein